MAESAIPLLERITTVDNLTRAWQHVRSNIRLAQRGRSHGSDEVTIVDFEHAWVEHMEQLAHELRTERYHPLPPRTYFAEKRDGGRRTIAILAVRDRIAQRAVLQVLEPLIEPTFLDCSYGFRPYVGVPHAIARVERYRQQGLAWAGHADIADCFGSIDHAVLLSLLERRIADRGVVRLISQWLQVGVLSPAATTDASQWWEGGREIVERVTDQLTDVARRYAEQSASMGDLAFVGPDALPLTPPFPPAPEERSGLLRQRAMQGLAANAALWGLTYARQLASGARRLAPLMQRVPGGGVTVGLASLATLAVVPLAQRLTRARLRGTLQGGALSPLLVNLYLDPFDRAMLEQGHTIVRFADDFLVLGATSTAVAAALRDAERVLDRQRMQLNARKTQIGAFDDGLTFLGHRFTPHVSRRSAGWQSFTDAREALIKISVKHRTTRTRRSGRRAGEED